MDFQLHLSDNEIEMGTKPKLLILDNHDSFTYNLVECCRLVSDYEIVVKYTEDWVDRDLSQMDKIILSPGPGLPNESQGLLSFISKYLNQKPMLGICLGMQALALATGNALIQMDEPKHGYASLIQAVDPSDRIFRNVRIPFRVGRYHSWRVDHDRLDANWIGTSYTDSGVLMSMKHREWPVWGLQFHPESYITHQGQQILYNFLNL